MLKIKGHKVVAQPTQTKKPTNEEEKIALILLSHWWLYYLVSVSMKESPDTTGSKQSGKNCFDK